MPTLGIFFAIALTIFILHKIYAKFCIRNLDVHVSVSRNYATEGDALTLTEVLTNNKWLPIPWITVKFRAAKELEFAKTAIVTDAYYRRDLFHILMQQKITRRLTFTCSRRGYYFVDGVELTAWDVLMENRYIKKFPCDVRLTVYPGTIAAEEVDELCTLVYGQLISRHPINPDPFSFRGIREYSSSDPLKAVNFKASARGMGLMVNIWEYSSARQIEILLDVKRHEAWYNETLEERAIKIAASISEKMIASGTPTGFSGNGKSIISGAEINIPQGRGVQHSRAVLEALAYVDFTNQDVEHFAEKINEIIIAGNFSPEYWLITPYYSREIEAAFLQLKATGARAVWIMPGPKPSGIEWSNEIIFA